MSATSKILERSSVQAKGSSSLWKNGLVAGVLAAALNAAIFAFAVSVGVFPSLTFQPEFGAGMSVEPILLVSLVGALAGVGAFALLRSRVERPVSLFLRIAAVVLLLSFAAPFAIPGTAPLQAVVLNLMHVVVAATVVWAVLLADRG
jgi:hypothetical protein